MLKEAIDLGDDHVLVFSEYKGEKRVGGNVKHKRPDGTTCDGWIAFEGRAWALSFAPGAIATWTVVQDEPITLSPSIKCRACGDHGHIVNGKWEKCAS